MENFGKDTHHPNAQESQMHSATNQTKNAVNPPSPFGYRETQRARSKGWYHAVMNRTVTLTDEAGTPLGEMDLLQAHTHGGSLHRAISVYVFDVTRTMLLLQQRSNEKLLFAELWANTCCSHPFPGEDAKTAGERRLMEEMNFDCSLTEGPAFVYRADDPTGKGTEHEYDIILTGVSDPTMPIEPNPKEVADWKWIEISELQTDMKENPEIYAPWFHLGLPKVLSFISHE